LDLSQFDTAKAAEQGADLQLRHPTTDAPLPDAFISLVGADSDKFQAQRRKQTNRRLENAARRSGVVKLSDEEVQHDQIELLVAATIGWRGLELDGEKLAFSADNARMLYTRLPWVREQVDQFIGDRANFLKA
jgi:hypothetical protein